MFSQFGRLIVSSCIAVALLAACGGSQPIGAPGAMAQSAASIGQTSGIYVSENQSSESDVFGYPTNNRKNRGPICSENSQPTYDLAVDDRGNLIVPNPSVLRYGL